MRNLIIALAIVSAQPALADQYYLSIPTDTMAKLVLVNDLPAPAEAVVEHGKLWGFIEDNSPRVATYLEHAHDIIAISHSQKEALRKQCGGFTPSCFSTIMVETGHDQETDQSTSESQTTP